MSLIAAGAKSRLFFSSAWLWTLATCTHAYVLTETASSDDPFVSVVVEWSDSNGDPIGNKSTESNNLGFISVTFNTTDIEKNGMLRAGVIKDWKQTRTQRSGKTSTLEGKFAKRGSPLEIISYEEAYSLLGLNASDMFFLPDFAADLDGDGVAETPLFSAINLFTDGLRFLNHEDFSFGLPYLVTDFPEMVFSLTDSLMFDPLDSGSGFKTTNPAPANLRIIADAEHITGLAVPEPSPLLLLITGVVALAAARARRTISIQQTFSFKEETSGTETSGTEH